MHLWDFLDEVCLYFVVFWGPFGRYFGHFGYHFGDFAPPGRHWGDPGGHLGPKVPKVTKNMVRGPPPGYPFGHHFGTFSQQRSPETEKNRKKQGIRTHVKKGPYTEGSKV